MELGVQKFSVQSFVFFSFVLNGKTIAPLENRKFFNLRDDDIRLHDSRSTESLFYLGLAKFYFQRTFYAKKKNQQTTQDWFLRRFASHFLRDRFIDSNRPKSLNETNRDYINGISGEGIFFVENLASLID